jgi:predicted nucleotidyltransferase
LGNFVSLRYNTPERLKTFFDSDGELKVTDKLNTLLKETRKLLSDIYGQRLNQVILFGSQARGDSGPASDIDLMIILNGSVHAGEEIARTGEISAKLSLKYNTSLSCVFVSSDRYQKEQSPLLLNVRREGVAV